MSLPCNSFKGLDFSQVSFHTFSDKQNPLNFTIKYMKPWPL